jgi:hypothetical protein
MSNRRYLSTALRRSLEAAICGARKIAEEGASDAIRRLGVTDAKPPSYLSNSEKELRRRLRAHARALGDVFNKASDRQETRHLIEAAAYAHWHRMLFARFLAERGLLRHPVHDAPVTLEDCRDLAAEEGLADGWTVAERYAAAMLPAVFRIDDPVLALVLDPVHAQSLQRLVVGLDADLFLADDSLGWTYQFWRAAEKDAVNESGVKIGADELPAVTQLFTESYMVRLLLHNTIGAWWAAKRLANDPAIAETAADEDALRTACAPPGYRLDMLRFVRETDDSNQARWRPAAGSYPGWPTQVRAITMLDPCCGSGHFLTEALAILAALRQAEDGLSPAEAVAAVLRENLHGLEIDGRCVQIAAFAVALAAWRIGGWQSLPLPHIAWVGAPPPLPEREFIALAGTNSELQYALAALHDLFTQAPLLGSLLKPSGADLFEAEKLREIERLMEPLLRKVRDMEPEHAEGVIAARGMADAAALLHKRYTFLTTNVPFLGSGKQIKQLADYIARTYPNAKTDLSVTMLARMFDLADENGCVAAVSPQTWYFLGSYKNFRRQLLTTAEVVGIVDLGPAAFQDMNWWAARTALTIFVNRLPDSASTHFAIDADTWRDLDSKPGLLTQKELLRISQTGQLNNPDSRLVVGELVTGALLSKYAYSFKGISTNDDPHFVRCFWELRDREPRWDFYAGTVDVTKHFGGNQYLLLFEGGRGALRAMNADKERDRRDDLKGSAAWGKRGISVNLMGSLKCTSYLGTKFDANIAAIVPYEEDNLLPIFAFCLSDEFCEAVRVVDQKSSVTNATLVKVPFDLDHWRSIAHSKFPCGLPAPRSNDPTQWLFHGHPANADRGTALHIALARISGYRWPAEANLEMSLADEARAWIIQAASLPETDADGLLGIPSVAGKKPLADRLRAYLAAAFSPDWSDTMERRLVAEADEALDKRAAREGTLEAWLRDRAFRQHCVLFQNNPFLWHVWDGLTDGFSVFINYHRFDQTTLRKLTYTVLGDWIARARAEKNELRSEKARELQQKLERILEGEKPYDIFVRWKPLAEQPIGWDPDINDGVRMNIRPFITARILRDTPKIKWTKDRGTDVVSAPWKHVFKGDRINDHHTTLSEKRAAGDEVRKRVASAV